MDRRHFIKNGSVLGGSIVISPSPTMAGALLTAPADALPAAPANTLPALSAGVLLTPPEEPWFNKSMRWAQLAFVETDPKHYDPDFWLDYFKRIHADGVLLS